MIGLHRQELRLELHDAGWAALYDGYRARILAMFKGQDLLVAHVGSTAVAGLVAKPVIDIAVLLPGAISDAACCIGFEQAGFIYNGDQGGEGGLLFVEETAPDVRACHIHVYRRDDPQWEATLCFRDWLRRDEAARRSYASLKQVGIRQGLNRLDYLEAKADFVRAGSAVLQGRLPEAHKIGEGRRRLPGIQPLDLSDWLLRDEAFAGQMALRDRLIATQRADVLRLSSEAKAAAQELLVTVLRLLGQSPAYQVEEAWVKRPDGGVVPVLAEDPLGTLGRLVQGDFCLLEKHDGEHVLTGAVLCFPASWSLADKFMKPLGLIHQPVGEYDDDIGKRVQRMFDLMRSEQPLWRSNVLLYDVPSLFTPYAKAIRGGDEGYVRSERQSLVKLPKTGAVVFSIHTYLVRAGKLTAAERAVLIPATPSPESAKGR
ncbi:MAG: heme-dependent oxidative N-demethylase subunit alpha family protein [Paracoccaceae bacterium]